MLLQVQRTSRVKPESAYLRNFVRQVTSQRGEDGIIAKIFEIVGATNRYCVEFGAWDGKTYSNTWNLLNNAGWGGLQIEGNEERFRELQAEYADHDRVTTLNSLVESSGARRLDTILAQVGAPKDLDLLCIDVDGIDWYIWNALSDFAPRLVVIEFNPSVPNDVIFVQDDDASVNQGASLLALVELGKSKGYELVATTEWNGFFIRKELFAAFHIEDNHIDAMHDPGLFETRLFQCYDGTLVLAGCTQLLWSTVTITQEDIQILPASLRKFAGIAS